MPLLTTEYFVLFCFALAVVAFLYASVGHGGASGYLALMILFSFSLKALKINALALNCFVSIISFFFFFKIKKVNFKLFFPFATASIPASFLGGYLELNETFIKIILGVVLVFSVVYINGFLTKETKKIKPVRLPLAYFFGFFIGLLSGLLGIGGGIILTPLLLILGWATIIEAASVSALFIFVNSIAGILGYFLKGNSFELVEFKMIPFSIIGGLLGSFVGSHYFSSKQLRYVLSIVVLFASIKLIFS
jgi:uncharacterized membrane protein YfcA